MTYSLAELTAATRVSPRTVRFYVSQGLLRGPEGSGPAARYDEGHLARLRLIRRLQAQHLPLAEIRARLAALSDDEIHEVVDPPAPNATTGSALEYVRSLLGAAAPVVHQSSAPTPPPAPAAAPVQVAPPRRAERSQWERIVLDADVELHVRRPLSRQSNKRVERLVAIARELFEEEGS